MAANATGRPMRALALLLGPVLAIAAAMPADAAPTIAAMRGHRRVLIVATPSLAGARFAQQRRALAGWRGGARARDLTMVAVSGAQVIGAADRVALVRRRWHLPPGEFQVVLVGKDGHEALRATHPLSAATLQRTIDAMPMRRAGRR